jgi:hypothetical protein
MKTNAYFSLLASMALMACLAMACGNDDANGDTTKPVISLIEPENGDTLRIGATVHLEMDLSDNEMLRSYKVNIHSNFDSHTHAHAFSRAGEDAGVPFDYARSWDVSGRNEHVHQHDIEIPANATPGAYHFMVYCTDAAGNEVYVARDVILSHEGGEHHDDDDD